MNKIYLFAHATRRFQDDLAFAGTHEPHPACDVCGRNLNKLIPPLLYYWDEEFGTPELSISQHHSCFWGDLSLVVNENGKAILNRLGLPLRFAETQLVKTKLVRHELIIEHLPTPDKELFWAMPTSVADADPQQSGNEVCHKCKMFTKKVRQLTRLRIVRSEATAQGIFSVRQNCGGPMFVTEEIKAILNRSGLKGVGFYPAGRIIDCSRNHEPQR